MIIDCHVHIWIPGMVPLAYEEGCIRTMVMAAGRALGQKFTYEQGKEMLYPMLQDEKGEKYLAHMDEAGIDKAVLFGVDFGEELGEPEIPIFEMNRKYADLCKAHPDRFVALCAIDPRRKGAMDHIVQCIEEWEMKGIKLHPSAGFNPMDPVMYPVYEKCAEWDLPLLIHSGAQPAAPVVLETARPVWIAEAASKFPDTKFIAAHFGMDWWPEAIMFGRLLPNLYFDCSYWQFLFGMHGEEYYSLLRRFIDDCGAEKVLWGTDTPLPNVLMPPKDWLDVHTNPRTEVAFTPEEIKTITETNSVELFKL
ncbi:MAG: amidohydrolase [Actinobacteria bacterium]|nr:amidohydrolase [Actinomycetota bacterium]